MVEPDGGDLEFLGIEGGVVRVRYRPGHNEECETCVLEPADLRDLMLEVVQRQEPAITDIEIITAEG
jgi:Fe-S cluster biogenesis protein NfuA